ADRGARPLQAVFLVGEEREAYLGGEPANDDRFIGVFAHELEHTGGYSPEDAASVARKLLPDILSYDFRRPVLTNMPSFSANLRPAAKAGWASEEGRT
ncbi:MAG TPA: hypothetical protein VK603_01070, partial [Candidatus Saccharimonadales bacterium]|nr:hypothetical protein [Candidatus Saccharimonadales bacterium]